MEHEVEATKRHARKGTGVGHQVAREGESRAPTTREGESRAPAAREGAGGGTVKARRERCEQEMLAGFVVV
jgi:hypothetical protein